MADHCDDNNNEDPNGLERFVWRKLHYEGCTLEELQVLLLREGGLELTLPQLMELVRQSKDIGDEYLDELLYDDATGNYIKRNDPLIQHHDLHRDIVNEVGKGFCHSDIVRYFKTKVVEGKSWEKCLAIEAMARKGISEDEIRKRMTEEDILSSSTEMANDSSNDDSLSSSSNSLFVEAVLMGEKRNYFRAMAMKFAGIPEESIYRHMCAVEGADPDLMAALLQPQEQTEDLTQTHQEKQPMKLEKRDYRGYRYVRDTIQIEKAKQMKRMGVPDGAIRQRLLKESIPESKIEALFSEFKAIEEKQQQKLNRKSSCGTRSPPSDVNTSQSVSFSFDDRETVTSCDMSSDDEDEDDSDIEVEQDSSARLRTAVFRKVKSMVDRGKPDAEIRNELVSMKGVDSSLVSLFLDSPSNRDISDPANNSPNNQENESREDTHNQSSSEWVEIPASAAKNLPIQGRLEGEPITDHPANVARRHLVVKKIHFLKTLGVSRDVIVDRLNTCGISPPFVKSVLSSGRSNNHSSVRTAVK